MAIKDFIETHINYVPLLFNKIKMYNIYRVFRVTDVFHLRIESAVFFNRPTILFINL